MFKMVFSFNVKDFWCHFTVLHFSELHYSVDHFPLILIVFTLPSFKVNNRIAAKVRGTVFTIGPDGLPPADVEMQPEWNNPPIDPDNVIELLKRTTIKDNSIAQETDNTKPSTE